METNETKLKYFLYARKSSESEDRQVQSIEDQTNRLKEMAKDLNLEIVKIFTESKSAKTPNNRPVFNEMIERIEKGQADGIVCWQLNRLFRNPIDSARIAWMLQENIIKTIYTIDRTYLPEDNVIMFSVESGMANQFIIDLRKNTKRGLAGKVERGWLPGREPQGYLNDVINKTIIKDPERFDLIKKMWEMMVTGTYSASRLLDVVTKDWGYLTKQNKRSGGKPMCVSEIYRIFNDPFYYGHFRYKGKIYKGNHEPMITFDEFERVQNLLGRKDRPKQDVHEFSFTGIIRCGHCGCLVTAEKKTKFVKALNKNVYYVYYRCTRRKREMNCKETPIRLADLESQILKEIDKYTIPAEFKDWALDVIRGKNDSEVATRNHAYEMLNNNYLELQKQLDNLTKLRLRELVSDEEFVKERTDLQNQITNIREKLNHNHERGQDWIELVEKVFNFAVYARERFTSTKSLKVKREIAQALGMTYTLKSGQLSIKPIEWLVPISNLGKNRQIKKFRLEPTKNWLSSQNNQLFADENPLGGDQRELNPR